MKDERRDFPRMQIDSRILLGVANKNDLFEGRIRDLSLSGVFIYTQNTRPIGTKLDLELQIKDDDILLQVKGIIVHEFNKDEAKIGEKPGIGVMFLEADKKLHAQLQKLIDFEKNKAI